MSIGQNSMVSVIIPAHAKVNRLALTLAGIVGQQNFGSFELIIVADGANNEVKEFLSENYPKYVLETPGLGRAAARNMGAKHATGDLLIFLDDDVLVKKNFVIAHMQAQQVNPGLVHGQMREIIGLLKVDNPCDGSYGCPPISINDLIQGVWKPDGMRLVANPLEQAAETQKFAPWLASAGANISVSRYLWQSVDGFDESYGKHWGVEDLDFGFRLSKEGVHISLSKNACGFHMSHTLNNRWEQHKHNLQKFQLLANSSSREAQALDCLLSPKGSLIEFETKLDQMCT